jgi:TIR domain
MARSPTLEVFISYAREDQKLVDAVADALVGSFQRSINVTRMSEFPLGSPFRDKIDEAIDKADVILAIASNRQRFTFTFTGYEVGYFRRSRRERRFIIDSPPVERALIPFAVLTDIPGTMSEFEGLQINEADRPYISMNEKGLAKDDPDPVIYKLLLRLGKIIDKLDQSGADDEKLRASLLATYKEKAEAFSVKLNDLIRLTPIKEDIPKTKIVLRMAPGFNLDSTDFTEGDAVKVMVTGPTQDIFSSQLPSDWLLWREFIKGFGGEEEIALNWKDTISYVLKAVQKDDFSDSDQIVLSHDSQNVYRLFVSKSTTYYDQSRQIDFYVIHVLQLQDVGDPFTSYLGKALAIALRYRSLFLEDQSPFTPTMFRFFSPNEIKTKVSQLLKELRILFVRGREGRLADSHNIMVLFGANAAAGSTVQNMMREWEQQKGQLNSAAEQLIRTYDPSKRDEADAMRTTFINRLEEFCNALSQMNEQYMDIVIQKLNSIIKKS